MAEGASKDEMRREGEGRESGGDGALVEGRGRSAGSTSGDSMGSVPSEFDISSSEVDKLLEGQSFSIQQDQVDGLSREEACDVAASRAREFEQCRADSTSWHSEWWTDRPDRPVRIRYGDKLPASEDSETVLKLFERTVQNHGEHAALAVKRQGEWKMWSYEQYFEECHIAAKAFIELGLEPYHGVCILGFNAPEWHISCLGAILACGISVGLYLTSSAETCYNIAHDCKAQVIVVENDSQLQKILKVKDRLPYLKAIVQYTKTIPEKEEDIELMEWRQFMQLGMRTVDKTLQDRLAMLESNKCCTLIYTSGTSGKPKGVMLSHDNLTWMCRRVMIESTCRIGEENIVSYLPLSHIATLLLDMYTSMAAAGTCWFAQHDALKGSLLQTMKEVRPTIFLGVPRVWEKIAESMQLVARGQTGLKSRISSWAKSVGFKRNYRKQTGGSGNPFGWTIANAIFFKRVRHALGLDRCHFPMAGGAPMTQETLAYFMSVNIPVHEIYGLSETAGPTTVTTTDQIRFMSSGRPFEGAEVRIENPEGKEGIGEVLVRGRHVFMGYLGEPLATRSVLTSDGWLKSGDLGFISELPH